MGTTIQRSSQKMAATMRSTARRGLLTRLAEFQREPRGEAEGWIAARLLQLRYREVEQQYDDGGREQRGQVSQGCAEGRGMRIAAVSEAGSVNPEKEGGGDEGDGETPGEQADAGFADAEPVVAKVQGGGIAGELDSGQMFHCGWRPQFSWPPAGGLR